MIEIGGIVAGRGALRSHGRKRFRGKGLYFLDTNFFRVLMEPCPCWDVFCCGAAADVNAEYMACLSLGD